MTHLLEHLDSPLDFARAAPSQGSPGKVLADEPEDQRQELLDDGFGRHLQHGSIPSQLEHDSDEEGHDIALIPVAASSGP